MVSRQTLDYEAQYQQAVGVTTEESAVVKDLLVAQLGKATVKLLGVARTILQ